MMGNGFKKRRHAARRHGQAFPIQQCLPFPAAPIEEPASNKPSAPAVRHSEGLSNPTTLLPSDQNGQKTIYSKFGFLGRLAVVVWIIVYLSVSWYAIIHDLPLSLTILLGIGAVLYGHAHIKTELRWLFAASSARLATLHLSWRKIGIAAVIAAAGIDVMNFVQKNYPAESKTLVFEIEGDIQLRGERIANQVEAELLKRQLIELAEAELLEKRMIAEAEFRAKQLADNVIGYWTQNFEESLSLRSKYRDCMGCGGPVIDPFDGKVIDLPKKVAPKRSMRMPLDIKPKYSPNILPAIY